MTPQRAYLLGFFLGDGCLTIGSRGHLQAKYWCEDEDVIRICQQILFTEFGISVGLKWRPDKNIVGIESEDMAHTTWILMQVGRERHYPVNVFNWNRNCQLHFVAGLMDTDGFTSIQKDQFYKKDGIRRLSPFRCLIGFCNTADWIKDVRKLMQSLNMNPGGIASTMTSGKGFKRTKPIQKVYVSPTDFIKAGGFFGANRKHWKVREIAKHYGLVISSETTRQTLRGMI